MQKLYPLLESYDGRPGTHRASQVPTLDKIHVLVKFLLTLAFCALSVLLLSDFPLVAIVCADLVVVLYIAALFNDRTRLLFLLHVPVVLVIGHSFGLPFRTIGDGPDYLAVIPQYFDTYSFTLHAEELYASLSLLDFLKYTSLGVVPVFAVPDYYFPDAPDEIYYFWQALFHSMLCAIALTFGRLTDVLEEKYILLIGCFALLSPSFLELGGAPTRHLVTFFGILLLYFAYVAITERITGSRLVCLALAVCVVVISKPPLLLPFIIFVLVDIGLLSARKININGTIAACLAAGSLLLLANYFQDAIVNYSETARSGAGAFAQSTQLPLIGWIVKYIYALLAPFPWVNVLDFIDSNYGHNWPLFFMHVLSSLTGLYLLLAIVLNAKRLVKSAPPLRRCVVFGLIMSLSIIMGSIGFHSYLLIYFPFYATSLFADDIRVNPYLPISAVLLVEGFVSVFR